MRLICPSCRAQYEVDDDAIPSEGRDVQCGSCSTTWFQEHALTLSGAVPVPVTETTKPVFRHQTIAADNGIPAPQRMPDDSPADREKLLREIRAEAEQDVSFDAKSRIEREPLPQDGDEDDLASFVSASRPNQTAQARVAPPGKTPETDLDTADVHAYPTPAPPANPPAAPARPVAASAPAEEAFLQNLRSQIEEQNNQPEIFAATRSSSVVSAAERAGISLDPAKVSSPREFARAESLQRTIRDLASSPEPAPRRRSYSVGVYFAAVLFLLAFATYLLHAEITRYYPAAGPWLDGYVEMINVVRLIIQDLWAFASGWVQDMIGSGAPAS